MRLLLDTHCWLWAFLAADRLSPGARDLITDPRHGVYVSSASVWEMAIKSAAGKLRLPEPVERYVPSRMEEQGMSALPVEHVHALRVASLPPHHADPFDRLLIAQAQVERMTLVTADPDILRYEVEAVWAAEGEPPKRARGRRGRR